MSINPELGVELLQASIALIAENYNQRTEDAVRNMQAGKRRARFDRIEQVQKAMESLNKRRNKPFNNFTEMVNAIYRHLDEGGDPLSISSIGRYLNELGISPSQFK